MALDLLVLKGYVQHSFNYFVFLNLKKNTSKTMNYVFYFTSKPRIQIQNSNFNILESWF